jgi:hypothetical protein
MFTRAEQRAADLLGQICADKSYRVSEGSMPAKLLAVCSGLPITAETTCFSEEFGSFKRVLRFQRHAD